MKHIPNVNNLAMAILVWTKMTMTPEKNEDYDLLFQGVFIFTL